MTQEQPGSAKKGNYSIQSALNFHEQTKHSEISVRARSRALDWSDKPKQFKLYDDPSLTRIFLPRVYPHPEAGALDAVSFTASNARIAEKVDTKTLAEVLFYSAGLTREMRIGHGETIYMRAASATGALYPIELYVVSGEMNGIKAGVYHFAPREFALEKLRDGDHRSHLASNVGSGEGVTSAPFTIVFTSLAWRNAWKYEERSYRHWFWDCGVIVANLLAVCSSEGLRAHLVTGFIDKEVDVLLGLEEGKEATVALCPVGIGLETAATTTYLLSTRLPQLRVKAVSISEHETSYPIIWETNEASALHDRAEVIEWKKELSGTAAASLHHRSEEVERQRTSPSQNRLIPLRLEKDVRGESLPLYETILRRGSTRRFARRAIPFEKLSWILESSSSSPSSRVPLDATTSRERQGDFFSSLLFSEIYLIVNQVDGCPSGSFFFKKEKKSLELLKLGNLRNMSSYLCLEQPLFGDASVVLFLMTDLRYVLERLGNRGYRVAQLEAGVIAGRAYLSSYAQRLGASGSTFYDDAVTEFFSPHAEGKSCMIAVGIGVPDYKARKGKMILVGTQEEEEGKQQNTSP